MTLTGTDCKDSQLIRISTFMNSLFFLYNDVIHGQEGKIELSTFGMRGFIHSFILNIYIAPLQENYSEVLPTPARLKRAVLR